MEVRKEFTPQDQNDLAAFLSEYPKKDRGKPGVFKAMVQKHDRHTWQSWFNHYIKSNRELIDIKIKRIEAKRAREDDDDDDNNTARTDERVNKKPRLSAPPPQAPITAPKKSVRTPFTKDDERLLVQQLVKAKLRGTTRGKAFEQLAQQHPHHTASSWQTYARDHKEDIERMVEHSLKQRRKQRELSFPSSVGTDHSPPPPKKQKVMQPAVASAHAKKDKGKQRAVSSSQSQERLSQRAQSPRRAVAPISIQTIDAPAAELESHDNVQPDAIDVPRAGPSRSRPAANATRPEPQPQPAIEVEEEDEYTSEMYDRAIIIALSYTIRDDTPKETAWAGLAKKFKTRPAEYWRARYARHHVAYMALAVERAVKLDGTREKTAQAPTALRQALDDFFRAHKLGSDDDDEMVAADASAELSIDSAALAGESGTAETNRTTSTSGSSANGGVPALSGSDTAVVQAIAPEVAITVTSPTKIVSRIEVVAPGTSSENTSASESLSLPTAAQATSAPIHATQSPPAVPVVTSSTDESQPSNDSADIAPETQYFEPLSQIPQSQPATQQAPPSLPPLATQDPIAGNAAQSLPTPQEEAPASVPNSQTTTSFTAVTAPASLPDSQEVPAAAITEAVPVAIEVPVNEGGEALPATQEAAPMAVDIDVDVTTINDSTVEQPEREVIERAADEAADREKERQTSERASAHVSPVKSSGNVSVFLNTGRATLAIEAAPTTGSARPNDSIEQLLLAAEALAADDEADDDEAIRANPPLRDIAAEVLREHAELIRKIELQREERARVEKKRRVSVSPAKKQQTAAKETAPTPSQEAASSADVEKAERAAEQARMREHEAQKEREADAQKKRIEEVARRHEAAEAAKRKAAEAAAAAAATAANVVPTFSASQGASQDASHETNEEASQSASQVVPALPLLEDQPRPGPFARPQHTTSDIQPQPQVQVELQRKPRSKPEVARKSAAQQQRRTISEPVLVIRDSQEASRSDEVHSSRSDGAQPSAGADVSKSSSSFGSFNSDSDIDRRLTSTFEQAAKAFDRPMRDVVSLYFSLNAPVDLQLIFDALVSLDGPRTGLPDLTAAQEDRVVKHLWRYKEDLIVLTGSDKRKEAIERSKWPGAIQERRAFFDEMGIESPDQLNKEWPR